MMTRWEVGCKHPDDRRGEYSEIVAVETKSRSITAALKAAQAILDDEYVPGMRAVKAVEVPAGFTLI